MSNVDLLSISKGSVLAPAGCGKTQLIIEALKAHTGPKPVLVLTHTNAGIAALRSRLTRARVSPQRYRLATIDGWGMRLASYFPKRSRLGRETLELRSARADYPTIRAAVVAMLQQGHFDQVLRASYDRILVDEYQDCSELQHRMISTLSDFLPVCVVGDPMQAIFGFGDDGLADWGGTVCSTFPVQAELSTPWRWINAGAPELGEWLLGARKSFELGGGIDLSDAPDSVRWIKLPANNAHVVQLRAARTSAPGKDGRVLILADSRFPQTQREFAKRTPGAVTVEAVDLRDPIAFSSRFDVASPTALPELVGFAQTTMSGITNPTEYVSRIRALLQGRARVPATDAENVALSFCRAPSFSTAVDLLVTLSRQSGVRTHRPVVQRACLSAMNACHRDQISFHDSVLRVREEYRSSGRALPRRAVGSTLLLKGLEAEAAIILDGAKLDQKNLYVAMTRGSQLVVVCSERPRLPED